MAILTTKSAYLEWSPNAGFSSGQTEEIQFIFTEGDYNLDTNMVESFYPQKTFLVHRRGMSVTMSKSDSSSSLVVSYFGYQLFMISSDMWNHQTQTQWDESSITGVYIAIYNLLAN